MGRRTYNFDADLLLRNGAVIGSSAAAQVNGSDKIIDIGAARVDGMVVIDVTAVEIGNNNEEYDIILQGSSSASFASDIQNLAQMNLGATGVRQGGAIDTSVGRYEMPFTNYQDDIAYRYLRLYTVVAGTISTGINYTAFIATQPGK